MRLTGLLLLLLGAFFPSLFGQEISSVYTQYTVEDRLHSNSINYAMQDSKGYIWFIGGGSITRFNGTDFEELYTGGFANRMFEDSKGNLWICSGSNINLLDNFTLTNSAKYGKGIAKSLVKSYVHSIAEDSLGNIWYTANNTTTKAKRGVFSTEPRYITAYKMGADSVESLNLNEDKGAYKISTTGFVKNLPGGKFIFTGRSFKTGNIAGYEKIENQDFSHEHFIYPISQLIQLQDGSFLACSAVEIMHFNEEKIFYYERLGLETNITHIFQDKKENIWIGTIDGLWQAPGGNLNNLTKMDKLPNFQVTSIMEDNEGNIWFSTIGGGVIKFSGNAIERLAWKGEVKKSRIGDLVNHKGSIWFCNDYGTLIEMDEKNKLIVRDKKAAMNAYGLVSVGDTLFTSKRRMYTNGKVEILGELKGREGLPTEYLNLIIHAGGGNIWTATRRNMFLFNIHSKKILFDAEKEGFKDAVSSFSIDSKGVLWFTTGKGMLYFFKEGKITNAKKLYPQIYDTKGMGRILDVNIGLKDHMYLTYHRGVVIRTPEKTQLLHATLDLTSNKHFVLNYLKEDQSIWIAGFGGVDKFIYDKETETYIKSFYLGTKNGLPVVSSGRIISFQDKVYLGASDGLYIINSLGLSKTDVPPVRMHITDFQVSDSIFDLNKNIELSYNQNSPTLKIDGISFQKEKVLTYKYRLLGQSDEWLTTESKNIPFFDLKPGSYTFQVYGIRGNYDDIRGEESQLLTLSFKITPHFTQTWFFITTLFTLAALLLGYAVYSYVRWKDRQDRRQMLTTELKYQALQSQMSPHFIFNAMNSISYLVKNKKSKEADKYLNQFAGLLRGVLENAQYSFITLLEEMELVQSYLELEQLQFGKQFQFHIDMDPELMAYELQLPPMLLQPIIENAIRHGISPRGYGTVKVDFKNEDKYLRVSIEDDGVGRAFAENLKKQSMTQTSKTQVGIKNIRERINVLNHLYGLQMQMEINDLEEEGKPSGTSVVFTFPKIKYLPEIENSSFTSFRSFTGNSETEEYQKD